MSLFGESPPATPSTTSAAQSKSLFGDNPTSSINNSTTSLFADDDGDNSPWSMPTPKKSARQNLIKTLLPATEVPESYVDAYDLVLNSGESRGAGISLTGVRNILQSSNLAASDQQKILDFVVPAGQESANGLGRNEFNVLLALIGLAQEGEDITLDSVDERRKRLPQPKISYFDKLRSQAQAKPQPAEESRSPESPRPIRKQRQDSLGGDPTSDPWASPANKRAIPTRAAQPARAPPSQDGFSSTPTNGMAQATKDSRPSTFPQSDGPGESGGGWESFNGGGGVVNDFPDQPDIAGAFGSSDAVDSNRPSQTHQRSASGNVKIPPGTGELVTITILPEKQGSFLFQHHNYEVKTIRRGSSVVRRFSDFVWLLDCLQKRYPFRRLPLLPPKRVQVNGNHLAADGSIFLDKRRKGLVRFMNALVQHPILSQETLVVMFLTVPTELSVWRKQATISVQEEFTGKALPPDLEDSLPSTLPDLFDQVRAGVKRSAEVYIGLCLLMERLAKRNEAMAADNLKFSLALESLTEGSQDTYAIDTNDVPLLNDGINATAKHLAAAQTLLEDEARAWDAGVLEDIKKVRDAMVSMRDVFDRRDRYARDNIPQLERRIQTSETKLHTLRQKPPGQVKPGEMEKVESSIMADKESIVQQHARGVFIKECIRDEIVTFQSSIYAISHLHQDWAQERVKYAELQASNWRTLVEDTESMPVGE